MPLRSSWEPSPPAFLINLDESTDRLESATAQFNAAGISFERVPAFDGRPLARAELPDYDINAALHIMGRRLSGGEIGLCISHISAMERFLSTGAPAGLVFEDDVSLAPRASEGITKALEWLARAGIDWDIIHLGPGKHFFYTALHGFDVGHEAHQIDAAHYFPMGTHGLLWSRAGAAEFLRKHPRIQMPIDNQIQYWQVRRGRGLSVWPPLARPSGAASIIDGTTTRRDRQDRHPLYGLRKQRRLFTNKAHALRHKLAARRPLP